MLTVVETTLFQRLWPNYWTEEERGEFASFIAEHPIAGDVIPESGGIRKIRWKLAGAGKSGGVRVIYFTQNAKGGNCFTYPLRQIENRQYHWF